MNATGLLVVSIAGALLFPLQTSQWCSASSEVSVQENRPAERTFVGTISDFACGLKHTMHPELSEAECTRLCHTLGSRFALVVADRFYALDGDTAELLQISGRKAVIRGILNEQTQILKVIGVMGARHSPK